MTKMAHEPKRPRVRLQNGPELGQKRPAATSKTACMDVQNDPQNLYFFVSADTY